MMMNKNGLLSVSIQSKLVSIAFNIKKIAAIATLKFCTFYLKMRTFTKDVDFISFDSYTESYSY